MEFNLVYISCYDKRVSFLEFEASDELFVYAKLVDELVKDKAELFMLLASMKDESKAAVDELHAMCYFPEVFHYDISDFPPKREVEFAIDLVPGTSPMSMAPYRMYASELSGLKKKL